MMNGKTGATEKAIKTGAVLCATIVKFDVNSLLHTF